MKIWPDKNGYFAQFDLLESVKSITVPIHGHVTHDAETLRDYVFEFAVMGRFTPNLILLLIGFAGCQTLQPDTGTPTAMHPNGIQRPQSAAEPSAGLFAKTATYFQGKQPARQQVPTQPETVTTPIVPQPQLVAAARPPYRIPSNTLSPSRLLFDFGSDDTLPAPAVAETAQKVAANVASPTDPKNSFGHPGVAAVSPLKPLKDDPPKLRALLAEIEATKPEDLRVSLADAEESIAKFREERLREQSVWLENPHLEPQYLAVLRTRIIQNTPTSKNTTDTTAQSAAKSKTVRRIPEPEEDEDELSTTAHDTPKKSVDPDDVDESEATEPAPLPPAKPKRSRSTATVASTEQTEPAPLKNTAPEPLPPSNPLRKSSEFPALTQLNPGNSQAVSYGTRQGDIVQVNYVPETDGDWKAHARTAADLLRSKIENTPDGRSFANEGNLRLLELILGNRQEAARPFSLVEKPINDFWGNQMLGFSTLLDEVGNPDKVQRYSTAAFRVDEGLVELRKVCPLKLKNVQFIKDWAAFGVFLPRREDCQAGETVSLYLELENPTIRKSSLGYTVKTSISYELRDSAAKVVLKSDPQMVEDSSPSQKRDYFIHLPIKLPKSLPHGQYQLRVNVTDMNSETMKYAEEQLPFRVIPSAHTPPD